jgi:putative membrane protein
MAFGQDAHLVVSRRGFFARRLDIVPQERVQSVGLAQGPLLRALRLVRVDVDSPPGPVRVAGEARDLHEGRALVRASVELSRRARAQRVAKGAGAPPTAHTTQEKSPKPP